MAQYEFIRTHIAATNILPCLLQIYKKCKDSSKQLLLDCLWSLSFDRQVADRLRQDYVFVASLEQITGRSHSCGNGSIHRRRNSFNLRRNLAVMGFDEMIDHVFHKASQGILWQLRTGGHVRSLHSINVFHCY
jgi:hypothetical protein